MGGILAGMDIGGTDYEIQDCGWVCSVWAEALA